MLEIAALPTKEAHQIWEKIHLLMQDPTPDAKVKKQLKYMHGKLHRVYSGKYHIFYTFATPSFATCVPAQQALWYNLLKRTYK